MRDVLVAPRILRIREVMRRTGLSRSGIYRAEAQGRFCRRIQISVRSVGWLDADVDNWIRQRVACGKWLESEV